MQKINLIAQSVLELSHCEKSDDDEDEDDDTHQGWIIVRDGMYSVADKKIQFKTVFSWPWEGRKLVRWESEKKQGWTGGERIQLQIEIYCV